MGWPDRWPPLHELTTKGISPRRMLFGHVLSDAGPSKLAMICVQVGVLLGGANTVETLFALPEARRVITAVNQRNYPTFQVVVLAIATINVAR